MFPSPRRKSLTLEALNDRESPAELELHCRALPKMSWRKGTAAGDGVVPTQFPSFRTQAVGATPFFLRKSAVVIHFNADFGTRNAE